VQATSAPAGRRKPHDPTVTLSAVTTPTPPPPPGTPAPIPPGPPVPPLPPALPATEAQPAGWFPDPNGRHEHRYFNGRSWTADVADAGERAVDPLGSAPGQVPSAPFPPGAFPPGSPFAQPPQRGNGVATAALVCGIIGVLIAWMPFVVVAGVVLAILAVIFGVQGIRRAREQGTGRGVATAGLVLGVIGLLLAIVGIVLSVVTYRAIDEFISPAPHDVDVTECTVADGLATVSGTLTNLDDQTAGFTVFVSVDTDASGDQVSAVQLDDVGPDETREWQTRDLVDGDATECTASLDVYGPFPFGVEMDRP
jgi:hypothetical protein